MIDRALGLRALVLLVALAVCGCDGAPAPRPDLVDPIPADGSSEDAADAPSACVEDCVVRNQMRAEAIEAIRAECRAECAGADAGG